MASKNFPVIDSNDFHVNKLAPKNDTSESKNHFLLPSSHVDEDLPTQAAAIETALTTTINSTNNPNTNNNTVNYSNKLLTPTSTSTTTTNKDTSSANTNNSENNTCSKLIPSSIDEERNESEKYDIAYAAKKDVKGKILVLSSDQWKIETTLIAGDSVLAGLREAKLSKSKRIKIRYFPGGKTEDVQYHLILYLRKEPIIHIGINDSSYKTEDFIYKELVNAKETINKFHLNCKNMVITSPILSADKKEANNI